MKPKSLKSKLSKLKSSGSEKVLFLKEFKQSINEVNLAKEGKLKLKKADQLISEL